jgi:hypothetical protein
MLKIPVGGGTPTTLFEGSVGKVVLDATHAFFIGYGQVQSIPIVGGVPTLLTSTETGDRLTIDATHVYVTREGATPNSGKVFKVPKTGGTLRDSGFGSVRTLRSWWTRLTSISHAMTASCRACRSRERSDRGGRLW